MLSGTPLQFMSGTTPRNFGGIVLFPDKTIGEQSREDHFSIDESALSAGLGEQLDYLNALPS